jgi:hypothetical protein
MSIDITKINIRDELTVGETSITGTSISIGSGVSTWTIDDALANVLRFKDGSNTRLEIKSDGLYVNGSTTPVGSGTVTSVTGTSPIASSEGATPIISVASGFVIPTSTEKTNYDTAYTDTSGATPDNTASKIVKRDASGNFSAGTITASLTGTASGNIVKTGSRTDGNIPTFSGTDGGALGNGYSVETTLTGANTAIPRADAVKSYIDGLLAASDALIFKGTVGTGGTYTITNFNALATYGAGWTFKVITAGTIKDKVCEVGDLIIATVDRAGSGNVDADWTVVQTNIDGAVTGPASSTDDNIALFSGATGKLIKDSAKAFETTLTTNSDVKVPTSKAVATYVTGLGYVTSSGVTSVTGTSPIASSEGTTPIISVASGFVIPTTTEKSNYDTAYTDVSNATNSNTVSTIVKRDSSGNFSAGTITANLTGTASGNLALSGGTLTGTVKAEDLMIVTRKFTMLENFATQYILLCQNAINNDVNGHIRIDRTTANYQSASLDVIVTAGALVGVQGGSILTHQYSQDNENFDLVTLTYSGSSWVAIRYVGNPYPYTTSNFTGILRSTNEVNSFLTLEPSQVTSVALLPTTNSIIEINSNKIWHAGNDGIDSGLDADLLDGNHASAFALDNAVVKLTGNQTIGGTKTFTDSIFLNGNINSDGGTITANVDSFNVDGNFSADSITGTSVSVGSGASTWTINDNTANVLTFKDGANTRLEIKAGGLHVNGSSTPLGSGTVTSVSGTSPIESSGGSTPTISVASGFTIPTSTEKTNYDTAYTDTNSATNSNTVSTIVKRDASGNFSAGTITASLTGTASGNIGKTASRTVGHIPTWANVDGGSLGNGYSVETTLSGATTAIPRADAVKSYVDGLLSASDAMVFKGTLGTGGTVTALPTTFSAGFTFRIITAGTYSGIVCEVGDLIIAVVDRAGTGNVNSDWTAVQTNIDGAVTGPSASTSGNITTFSGTSGKVVADSGKAFETTLTTNSDAKIPTSKAVATYVTGLGYVTSSGVTSVTGTSPIASSGGNTPIISVASGFTIPTSTEKTNYDTAYTGVNTATSNNTASTIVKRDSSGNFNAGAITGTSISVGVGASTWTIDDAVSNVLRFKDGANTRLEIKAEGLFVNGSATALGSGTVTSVTGSDAIASSGGTTPQISIASGFTVPTSTEKTNYDTAYTDTSNAINSNTASTIVKRDSSGNFSAGTITASLTGNASGNVLKTGDTMSGTLTANGGITVPGFTNLLATGITANTVYTPDLQQIAQAPFGGILWHDVLAFNRIGTPTFEVSTNGTTFTSSSYTPFINLFAMKENQAIEVINPSSRKAARFILPNMAWTIARWLVIGHTYVASAPNITVLVESSSDGVNWTARHNSTRVAGATPAWYILSDFNGDNTLRLTITHNSGGNVILSSIRMLTTRWGDQGRGKEFESPFDWDGNRNVTTTGTLTGTRLISNIATGTAPLTVTSTTAVANLNADMVDGFHATSLSKRVNLTGQVQTTDFLKSVIALCELTNTNPSANSYSMGMITFHRTNGLEAPALMQIAMEKRYNVIGANYTSFVQSGNSFGDNIQYIRFQYNGVWYGGIEFFFSNATLSEVTFHGESNFAIFGLDYFNTQTSTAINTEVTGSITITNMDSENDLFINNNKVWNAQNDGAGSGLDADLLDGNHASAFVLKSGDTMTGTLTAPTIKLTNNATDTVTNRITVYDEANGISYGMMLWNSNVTSGDWATMIYGPNQADRRISFGKVNGTTFSTHSNVTEGAYFDLDNWNLILKTGKLGIGTETPSEKLSVEGDAYVKDRLRVGIENATHDSVYLDNSVGSPDGRNGLYSNNGDQGIAVFDGSNNSWHYANSNLIYTESTDTFALNGNLTINGNIINTGSTVTVNTTNLTVTDKNIELGFITPKTGLVATLSTGTANITLTTGTTEGMIPGQALTKTSGTGVFGTNSRIVTITGLTTLTATINHATAGSITFTASGATDFTADGGGITLKGNSDHRIQWNKNLLGSGAWSLPSDKLYLLSETTEGDKLVIEDTDLEEGALVRISSTSTLPNDVGGALLRLNYSATTSATDAYIYGIDSNIQPASGVGSSSVAYAGRFSSSGANTNYGVDAQAQALTSGNSAFGLVATASGVSGANVVAISAGVSGASTSKYTFQGLGGTFYNEGSVGIGSVIPLNKLEVRVTGADSNDGIMITRADTTTVTNEILGGIGFDSTDGNVPSSILEASAYIAAFAAEDHSVGDKGGYLTFGTAPIDQDDDTVSLERMRITTDGNVVIGTTTPSAYGRLTVANGIATNSLYASDRVVFGDVSGYDTPYISWNGSSTPYQLRIADPNYEDPIIIDTEAVSITANKFIANGSIGIGTNSPSANLEVVSSTSSPETGNGILRFSTGTGTDDRGNKIGAVSGTSGYSYWQSIRPGVANDGIISLNPTGGNVGIGTTSPAERLNINTGGASGGLRITSNNTFNPQIFFYNESTLRSAITSIANGNFAIFHNGGDRIAITQGGNVGIGTSSPATRLSVNTGTGASLNVATAINGSINLGNNGAVILAPTLYGKSNDSTGLALMGATNDSNTDGDLSFNIRENDNTDFATLTSRGFNFARFGTSLMTILRNGNVGIGTTSPGEKLEVNGNTKSTTFISTQASGTAPLTVASNTVVTNLNADLLDGLNSSDLLRVYRGATTLTNLDTFYRIARVQGNVLSSSIKMTLSGTTGSVVVNVIADILVNHSQDIVINSQSGEYTQVTIRVQSDNNENFDIYVKYNSGNAGLSIQTEIISLTNDVVTLNPSATAYTGFSRDHTTISGTLNAQALTVLGSTVWHAGNDGAGSTLDADLLDGNHASAFALDNSVVKLTGNQTVAGIKTFTSQLQSGLQGNIAGGNIRLGITTDATTKFGFITGTHYSSTAEPEGISIIGLVSNSTENNVMIGGHIYEANPATSIQFYTNPTTTNATGGLERMRILSDGKVGIGTITPDSLFEIKAATPVMTINGTTNNSFRGINLQASGTTFASLLHNSFTGETTLTSGKSGDTGYFLTFDTLGVERMRITDTGNVGIGTTSPTEQLNVTGITSTNFTGLVRIQNNSAEATGADSKYRPALQLRNENGTHSWGVVLDVSAGVTTGGLQDLPSIRFTPQYAVNETNQARWSIGYVDARTVNKGGDAYSFRITQDHGWDGSTSGGWGTDRLVINRSGDIGIGTATPTTKLQVNGTITATTFSGSGTSLTGLTTSNLSASAGIVNSQLANSSITIGTTAISLGSSSTTLAGLTSVSSTSLTAGTGAQTWQITDSSNNLLFQAGTTPSTKATLFSDGALTLTGKLTATSKSFLIDHPTKQGYKLQYGSLEGPETAVYIRGRLKNSNIIELPDYWTGLVDESTITVSLTAVGGYQKLFVSHIDANKVYIINDITNNQDIDCFYVVYGERKDIAKLVVEMEAQ